MIDTTKCYSCDLFNSLGKLSQDFAGTTYEKLVPEVAAIFPQVIMSWVLFTALLAVLTPDAFFSRAKKLPGQFLLIVVIHTALNASSGANFIGDWIVAPVEQVGVETGKLILTATGNTTVAANENVYADLSQAVEKKMMRVLSLCTNLVTVGGNFDLGIDMVGRLIAALFLALPFLVVLSIYVGFLIEALFKFVVIQMAAPFLLVAAAFKPTRSFAVAGIRTLAGAALTIVFASAAMGFTTFVVDEYAKKFEEAVGGIDETNESQRDRDAGSYCRENVSLLDPAKILDCIIEYKAAHPTKSEGANFFIFSGDYFILFVIGFASIIMHLQAKTLASNLSGASDGPGPAAITSAAGAATGLVGAGMKAWQTAKAGAGVARSGGQMIGNALGAGSPQVNNYLDAFAGKSGNSFGRASSPDSMLPGSGGGQAGLSSTPEMGQLVKSIDRQTKMFEQFFKSAENNRRSS